MGAEIDIIDPPATAVTINGVTKEITPMKIGQIPAFVRAAGSILDDLNEATTEQENGELDVKLTPEMIGRHGENIIEAVSIAARVEPDEVQDMDVDKFIELAEVCIKVNAGFFAERVIPAFQKAITGIVGVGATPSKNSSSAATASKT